jgi:hypothetical protein
LGQNESCQPRLDKWYVPIVWGRRNPWVQKLEANLGNMVGLHLGGKKEFNLSWNMGKRSIERASSIDHQSPVKHRHRPETCNHLTKKLTSTFQSTNPIWVLFVLGVLGFELRASHWLDRCSLSHSTSSFLCWVFLS